MINELPPRGVEAFQYVRHIGSGLHARVYLGAVEIYNFVCPRCGHRWRASAIKTATCPSGRVVYGDDGRARICDTPMELPCLDLDEIEALYLDGAGDA